jgi:hypothetical protein
MPVSATASSMRSRPSTILRARKLISPPLVN